MDIRVQPSTSNQTQEKLPLLTAETELLHETKEQLLTKVDFLENRLCHLDDSNTDLSCRLLQSEEERLKMTKDLVEEKLQTNKMREQYEKEMFEMKTKILNQVFSIKQLEQQCGTLQSNQACPTEKEKMKTLDKNVQTLAEADDKVVGRSEELKEELLTLANAQDSLRRQMEEQQHSVRRTAEGLHGELEGVKALISHMTQSRVQQEDLAALNKEQKAMKKTLLGTQDEMNDLLERIKSDSAEQQRNLDDKVAAMGRNHQESTIKEQSAACVCCQSRVKEVEEENSKLQLQLKELNEEYRAKLVCYLQDISDYIDDLGPSESLMVQKSMRPFVDGMLQDVRSSYRVREEQLSSAARFYKKRLQRVVTAHHALRLTYRAQREQILAKPGCDLYPGPPEANFSLEATELKDEKEKQQQCL